MSDEPSDVALQYEVTMSDMEHTLEDEDAAWPPHIRAYVAKILRDAEVAHRRAASRQRAALRWCPSVFLLNALALPSLFTGPRAFDGGRFFFPLQ